MNPSPAPRRGRIARGPLLGLCAALVLALGLFLIFRDSTAGVAGSRDRAVRPELGRGSAELAIQPGAAEGDRSSAVEPVIVAAEGGLIVRPGVRLAGAGLLAGRVVERATGRGVAGARVELLTMPPFARNLIGRIVRAARADRAFVDRTLPVAVALTSGDGSFAFEGVREGHYYLDARGVRHVPESSVLVAVAPSGDGGPVDIFVKAGGRLRGEVLRPDGRPASGAKVAVYQGFGGFLTAARRAELHYAEAHCDAQGQFLIAGLAPGRGYELAATGAGFAISHLMEIEVRAGEDTWVRLRALEGARIEGQVLAAPQGEGDEPRPLAGAHVGAVPRGLRHLIFLEEILLATHVVTDAQGRYLIEDAPAGELDVASIAPGYLPGLSPMVRVAEGGLASAGPIVLKSGPVVQGRVIDSQGQPLPGVHVRWDLIDYGALEFDLSLAPMVGQAIESFDFPLSDGEGHFSAGPFPGNPRYRIELHKAGYSMGVHRWDPAVDGQEITVTLHRGGAVEGIVMDELEARPLTRFTISGPDRVDLAADAPGSYNPFSGGQLVEHPAGLFRVESVRAGSRELTFSAEGYLSRTLADIEVVEDEVTRGVIVKLRRGGTLRGAVVNGEGAPVPGAQVIAIDADEGARAEWRRSMRGRRPDPEQRFDLAGNIGQAAPPGTLGLLAGMGLLGRDTALAGPAGEFELVGVAAGDWRVHALHPDFAGGRSELVSLEEGGAVEQIEVRLSRGGGLHGTVTDRFGRPVQGAMILAVSPDPLAAGSSVSGGAFDARTDGDGRYRIEQVPGGGYLVLLMRDEGAAGLVALLGTMQFDLVTVPPDELVRYDIVDRSSGACRVHGTVSDLDGPVQRGMIFALGLEAENVLGLDVKMTQIRQGQYEFPGLAAGEYDFRIQVDGPDTKLEVEVADLPEQRLDLRLPEGGIEGRVIDDQTGGGVERAELILSSAEIDEPPEGLLGAVLFARQGGERTRTRADGTFRFRRLSPGDYELVVQPPSSGDAAARFAPSEPLELSLRDGERLNQIEVRLQPALELGGVVRDPDGQPLAGAAVSAFPVGEFRLRPARATSDAEGAFSLSPLRPGLYELSATREGFARGRLRDVELTTDPREPLELVLTRGALVSVVVRDPAGSPVAGALARLVRLDAGTPLAGANVEQELAGLFTGRRLTKLDGRVELGRFPEGRYRLEVNRGSSSAVLEEVQLAEGDELELEAVLD